jgi:hypothetical protein
MTSPRWEETDDSLLSELSAALRNPEPVPHRMHDAAKAAFSWRSVDDELELMLLVYDSSTADGAVVRSSFTSAPRTLAFEAGALCLEVEVGSDDIMGQLIPPQPARVTVVTAAGTFAETEADETGCFQIPRPTGGPVQVRCATAAASLATDWMPL